MIRSFQIMGVELAQYVTEWDDIEEVKEANLAKSTLFTGELFLTLENSRGQFSGDKDGSLFKGRSIFNLPCVIAVDGNHVFNGYVKDIQLSHERRTARFILENVMSIPAERNVSLTALGTNPVYSALGALNQVGLTPLVDYSSFISASGPSRSANALIDVSITEKDTISCLSFLQQISDIASVSFFSYQGRITARAFSPYTGNEANLKAELKPSNVRSYKSLNRSPTAFNNVAVVPYGLSDESVTITDQASVVNDRADRKFIFDTRTGSKIVISDLDSAYYFGRTYLSRASMIPQIASVEVGKEFYSSTLGDRHPLTAPNWGLVRTPFEIIEVHRSLQMESVELVLRRLA